MFDEQYRFKGRHAERVDKLTAVFDSVSKSKLFDRNVDIYVNAPLIGFLYGRTAERDNSKNPETDQVYNQNIMGDRVMQSKEDLMFNFRLIMLLDVNYEPDPDKRIDKAFRNMEGDPKDEEHFDEYVRGGVDVLYEKLIKDAETSDDYINNLYEFVEDFQERFNEKVTPEIILELCGQKSNAE